MTDTPKVPRFSRKPLDGSSSTGMEDTLPSGSNLVAPVTDKDVAIKFRKIVAGRATPPVEADRNSVADIIQFIKNAADAPALYEAWHKFRNAYFDIIDRLGENANFAYDNALILLQRAIQAMDEKIKTPTGNTPTTTSNAPSVISANSPMQSDAVEIALVRAQRYTINELQKSAAPKDGVDTEANVSRFYEKWNYLKDPSVWIEEVFFSKMNVLYFKKVREKGVKLRLRLPKQYKTMPSFSHEKPQTLLEAIDRIFLEVAKMRDVVLEFSFEDIQKGLVITSTKSFKDLRRNLVVADLINQLGGKWKVHGSWARVMGIPMGIKNRIVIPLKATFPSPSQPSQSNNGKAGGGPAQAPSGNGQMGTQAGSGGNGRSVSSVAGIFYPEEASSSEFLDPWTYRILQYELMTQGALNYFYYHHYQPSYFTQPQCRIMTFPPVSQPSSFAVLSGG